MKKHFIFFLTGLAIAVSAAAQEAAPSGAFPFLAVDRDAVTGAMGGAQSLSPLCNPAVIPFSGSDVQVGLQRWAPATTKATHINALSGIKLGARLGLSVTAVYQMGEPYAITDASGKETGVFKPSDFVAGIGMGYAFTDFLSAGVNVKIASQTLAAGSSVGAVAADAFVAFSNGGLQATAGVTSLGSSVKDSQENSYALPSSAKLGIGYSLPVGLAFRADADYFFAGGFGAGAGVQYAWKDMVFVRAGYHLGSGNAPIPSFLSLGAGFKFASFHVDLTCLMASEALGGTLQIGLGYAF
mgnify:CR=1 FL=1